MVVSSLKVPVRRPFHASAVVTPDVDDERVFENAHLIDRIDHTADVPVGVSLEPRVHLHLPGIDAL